jgi:hypothetical protein
MLASITPLGERSRGFSWRVTAGAFALGALGALIPRDGWRLWTVAAAALAALLVDASPLRGQLPTSRRQVNEQWLGRYRGWVYGLGFGAQLGAGVVTIVTTAAIYAAAVAMFASGSALAGAAIGAAFGAFRALSLVPARSATDPPTLAALHRRLLAVEAPVRRGALLLQAAALLVALGALA